MKQGARHNPDDCTACAICTMHCPVAAATLKFRGPKLTGPSYERFRLSGFEDDASVEYCSNCKSCEIACPSGVPIADFNMLARSGYSARHGHAARDMLTGHSGDLGKLSSPLPAFLLNTGMKNRLARSLLDRAGIDKRAPLPAFAPLSERRRLRKKNRGQKTNLALFPGCFARYYDPNAALDIVDLLETAGYTVSVPDEFVCCGLPLLTGGLSESARKRARINSKILSRLAENDVPVVTPCPSCALMLSREYEKLFSNDARVNNHPVSEAGDFILRLIAESRLSLKSARAPRKPLAYHAPCHLRALGVGLPALEILKRIPGLQVENMDAGCCGISGSYGFKKGKYEIAMRIGQNLFHSLENSGAQLGLSECGTCRVQMTHGSGLPAAHPLSILHDSLAK